MITPEERAAIRAEVATWEPLRDSERDLVCRALASVPASTVEPLATDVRERAA